jgi:hypothetical protein
MIKVDLQFSPCEFGLPKKKNIYRIWLLALSTKYWYHIILAKKFFSLYLLA